MPRSGFCRKHVSPLRVLLLLLSFLLIANATSNNGREPPQETPNNLVGHLSFRARRTQRVYSVPSSVTYEYRNDADATCESLYIDSADSKAGTTASSPRFSSKSFPDIRKFLSSIFAERERGLHSQLKINSVDPKEDNVVHDNSDDLDLQSCIHVQQRAVNLQLNILAKEYVYGPSVYLVSAKNAADKLQTLMMDYESKLLNMLKNKSRIMSPEQKVMANKQIGGAMRKLLWRYLSSLHIQWIEASDFVLAPNEVMNVLRLLEKMAYSNKMMSLAYACNQFIAELIWFDKIHESFNYVLNLIDDKDLSSRAYTNFIKKTNREILKDLSDDGLQYFDCSSVGNILRARKRFLIFMQTLTKMQQQKKLQYREDISTEMRERAMRTLYEEGESRCCPGDHCDESDEVNELGLGDCWRDWARSCRQKYKGGQTAFFQNEHHVEARRSDYVRKLFEE